jgi:YfiR/HmsC-like
LPRRVAILFALLLTAASPLRAQVFSADAVKAAFLFRFASYVQWPADAPGTGAFVIATADGESIADQLDVLLPGMSVHGRPVEVRRISNPEQLDGVHILYVGPGNLTRTRALRTRATTLPILVVTDREGGIDAGGVINFLSTGRNVRFEVSLIAADRARLDVDSALLSVAARVERRPQARLRCTDCQIHAAVMP